MSNTKKSHVNAASWILFMMLIFFDYTSWGLADDDTSGGFVGRGHRVGKRMRVGEDGAANSGTIHGHCTLLEGNGNPISGPCVNLILVLNDANGNEVLRTRTSSGGDFVFLGEKNVQYQVVVESRSYEIAGPAKSIRGGEHIDLKLRYK